MTRHDVFNIGLKISQCAEAGEEGEEMKQDWPYVVHCWNWQHTDTQFCKTLFFLPGCLDPDQTVFKNNNNDVSL